MARIDGTSARLSGLTPRASSPFRSSVAIHPIPFDRAPGSAYRERPHPVRPEPPETYIANHPNPFVLSPSKDERSVDTWIPGAPFDRLRANGFFLRLGANGIHDIAINPQSVRPELPETYVASAPIPFVLSPSKDERNVDAWISWSALRQAQGERIFAARHERDSWNREPPPSVRPELPETYVASSPIPFVLSPSKDERSVETWIPGVPFDRLRANGLFGSTRTVSCSPARTGFTESRVSLISFDRASRNAYREPPPIRSSRTSRNAHRDSPPIRSS